MVQLMEVTTSVVPRKGQHPKLRNKKLLAIFDQLTDGQDDQRKSCTERLIAYLNEQESATVEDNVLSGDLKYSTKRLVQGISSGRHLARLGYSVALCQLLRSQENINNDMLFGCIDDTSKAYGSTRNATLGKVFAYLVLVQSKKLFSEGPDKISEVVQELMKLGEEKDYLPHLCSVAVSEIISQVKHKVFLKYVFPHIEEKLTAGWDACTPEDLLLVIHAKKHHMKVMEPYLLDKWDDVNLLSENTFHQVAKVLKKSLRHLPVIHSVVDAIINEVVQNEKLLIPFWKTAISQLSTKKGSAISVHVFEKLIPHLTSPKQVEEVLHPVMTIQLSCRNKDAISQVMTLIKSNSQIQLPILKCFILHSDLPALDILNEMTSCFEPESVKKLKKELFKAYTLKASWMTDKKDVVPWSKWCGAVLDTLVTRSDDSSWQLDILQFLFVHSYFTILKSSDIPHCGTSVDQHPDPVRASTSQHFLKAVTRLLSHNKKSISRTLQFNQHLDVLFNLVLYGQTLLQKTECVQLQAKNFTDKGQEQWNQMIKFLPTLQEKRSTSDSLGLNHAFELMFLYGSLQLFSESSAVDFLQELHACYKNTTKRRKSKAFDAEEPEWIEVITELLLSLMFKGSLLSRNIAKIAMGNLANYVTPEALELILDALQQKSLDDEDGMVGVEGEDEDEAEPDEENKKDEDENEDEDSEDNEDADADDNSSSSSSSDEDDSDEEDDDSGVEEEQGIDVPDAAKRQVKEALGDAAVDSGDSSEEEDDLSDTEMFQLDEKLAEAFKAMNKTRNKKLDKERKQLLLQFKIRSFDLLEAIVKNNPSVGLLKEMIVPLLDRMEGGHRVEKEHELGHKAKNIFELIYKTKKMSTEGVIDRTELVDLFGNLMKLSRKVTTDIMMAEVVKGCTIVVRMLLNLQGETEPSPVKTRSKRRQTIEPPAPKKTPVYLDSVVSLVEAGVMDMLLMKTGHCSITFFSSLLEKIAPIFWSMSEGLVKFISSLDIKARNRASGIKILAILLEKPLVRQLDGEEWNSFLKEIKTMAEKVLNSPSTKDKHLIKELLKLFLKIYQISPATATVQILEESEMKILEEMMSEFSHETAIVFRKVYKIVNKTDLPKPEKRKKNEDEASPKKKSKLDNQTVVNGNPDSSEESSLTEQGEEMETIISNNGEEMETSITNNGEEMETSIQAINGNQQKKKKKKKKQGDTVNDSLTKTPDKKVGEKTAGQQLKTPIRKSPATVDTVLHSPSNLTSSQKKKNKKKRKLNDSVNHEGAVECDGNDSEPKDSEPKDSEPKDLEPKESEPKPDVEVSVEPTQSPAVSNVNGTASAKKKKRNSGKFSPRYTRSMKK